MFHHSIYFGATGGAVTLQDQAAVNDTVFTAQNNHFIYTDRVKLLAAAGLGATMTQAQIYSPSLIPYGLRNIWPLNRALTPGSFPRLMDFRNRPLDIPRNEQIQFLASDTASENVSGHMWLGSEDWTQNKKVGSFQSTLVVTSSIATVAGVWSGLNAVTFQNLPKGGWYAVNGAWCFDANLRAFRLYFPRMKTVNGRQFRPGTLATTARGNLEYPGFNDGLGTWGAFHTFEPLQLEVFGDASGASSQVTYLAVEYLGEGDAGQYPL